MHTVSTREIADILHFNNKMIISNENGAISSTFQEINEEVDASMMLEYMHGIFKICLPRLASFSKLLILVAFFYFLL